MLPDLNDITTLIYSRLQGEISLQEEAVLQEALSSMQHYPEFNAEVLDEDTVLQWYMDEQRFKGEQLESNILKRIRHAIDVKQVLAPVHRVNFLKAAWFRYAAVLLLVLGSVAYYFYTNSSKQPTLVVTHEKQDIAPGRAGAILTLADGTQVVLDSLSNGVIATQNGAQVLLQNGQVGYAAQKNTTNDVRIYDADAVSYNTLTTPKGRQFQVVLSDGTKVWLNAASSLKYPTTFSGNERHVEVTGEAYFEVVENAKMPFNASVNSKTTIEVLGTSFNINAYTDESFAITTLLNGAIKIQNVILKPGQAFENGSVSTADIQQTIAWKNGAFNFHNSDVRAVMRQLSRWYDIDIVYGTGLEDKKINGKIGRDLNLSEVLEGLAGMGIQTTWDGKKLVVSGKP